MDIHKFEIIMQNIIFFCQYLQGKALNKVALGKSEKNGSQETIKQRKNVYIAQLILPSSHEGCPRFFKIWKYLDVI
jgi:hypothetical protein